MKRLALFVTSILLAFVLLAMPAAFGQHFKAGSAKQDITPTKPTPMWGYGDRHSALSQGVLDPLYAKAVVIDVGAEKLAIVGLDLGRSPNPEMMTRIRQAVKEASGVTFILMSGSHTHHGPVIELKDEPEKGQGVYDDAVAYVFDLEQKLVAVINEAASNVQDARIGWGSAEVDMNRNRHTKIEPKPTDSELSVLRFDDLSGNPIALVVNYAAHPTMLDGADLRFSAEYPGQMMNEVERVMDTDCAFMQGAAGDMSCRTTDDTRGIEAFGKALAGHVTAIAEGIETSVPESPSVQGMEEDFAYETRLDFQSPIIQTLFKMAFFPELAVAYIDELEGNIIRPHLTTVLVNNELALVGGSGEFLCNHAIRLKERSRAKKTLFFGYCNGHHMYFPTIEAAAEGGYGADPTVSWVALGAGEEMINNALINIYTMMGSYEFTLPGL